MSYIKKEPIIEFITQGLNNPNKTKAFGYDAIEILTEIKYAPTVETVEVQHGEWKPYSATMVECSICSKHVPRHQYEFCPHCGAKMDGRNI